jgi:hypothetical protein
VRRWACLRDDYTSGTTTPAGQQANRTHCNPVILGVTLCQRCPRPRATRPDEDTRWRSPSMRPYGSDRGSLSVASTQDPAIRLTDFYNCHAAEIFCARCAMKS